MISGDIHVYVLCSSLKWSSCLLKLNVKHLWDVGKCEIRIMDVHLTILQQLGWKTLRMFFIFMFPIKYQASGKENVVQCSSSRVYQMKWFSVYQSFEWSMIGTAGEEDSCFFFLWPTLPESISRSLKVTTHHKSHFRDTYCQRASSLCKNVILYCEWIIMDETRAEKNMRLCCQIE